MKILFIQPSDSHVDGSLKGGVWHAPPLGIASLAAFLRERKHTSEILDLTVDNVDIVEACKRFNPDYIGISVTTPLFPQAIILAQKLKKKFPDKKIVFGGPHPSTDIKEVLGYDFIDFVIFGEGEITLTELLDCKPLNQIKGLAYKIDKQININLHRQPIKDLDTLPMPAYDLLSMDKYPDHPLSIKEPNISIITSRGCPFECIYCNKSVFGRSFRKMSYKNIVDQIEYLVDKYGIQEFQIVDDIFTLDRERVRDFCKEILTRKLDIKWMMPNGTRAESLDSETLRLMKKAGCHYLYLGLESGVPKILDRIKKRIDLNQIREAVKIVNNAGIRVGAFFMMGLPDETPEDIKKTIDFAKNLKLDSVKFGIMVPLPGTEIFNEFKDKGFIKNFDYSSYFWHKEPVFETDLLSKETLFRYYKRAYREFYLRPQYIFRKVLTLRSFSDIRNNLKGLKTLIHNQLSNK